MSSSLAIINDEHSGRTATPATSPGSIRLVQGTESRAEHSNDAAPGTPQVAAVSPDNASAKIAPVQSLNPEQVSVADLEHYITQLDLEKVLLVPSGVTINGDIVTNGLASVVISGAVNGSVDAGSAAVIIREGGLVNGSIKADDSIVIAGTVTAANPQAVAIATGGLWILSETGCVRGDVAYGRHRAYEGAIFSGRAIPFAEFKQ
jgi:cytoskeletal protein CcmA (bactofilin family)